MSARISSKKCFFSSASNMGWYDTAKPSHVEVFPFLLPLSLFKSYLSLSLFSWLLQLTPICFMSYRLGSLVLSLRFSSSTLPCTFRFSALILHICALFLQKYSAEYFPLETVTGRLVLYEWIYCIWGKGTKQRLLKAFLVTVRRQPGKLLFSGWYWVGC